MNLLLCFPRTASSWTRYILEYFSDHVVDGHYDKKSVHETIKENFSDAPDKTLSDTPFATMVHHVPEIRTKPDKLVVSYRKAIEVLPSFQYSRNHKNKSIPIEEWMSKRTPEDFYAWSDKYSENLTYYHNFTGPKMILRYESLMEHPIPTIKDLTKFLGVYDDEKLKSFEEDYEKHRSLSLNYKALPKHMKVNTFGETQKIESLLPTSVKQFFKDRFKDETNYNI